MKKSELKPGEYLCIYTDPNPIVLTKDKKKEFVKEVPLGFSIGRLSGEISDQEFQELLEKGTHWKIFNDNKEFWRAYKREYMIPQFYEHIISGIDRNYRSILEDTEEYFGYYQRNGYYFVGAASGTDDYYWIYWDPVYGDFKYSSCIENPEINPNHKKLPTKYYPELTKGLLELPDIVFPNRILGISLI